MGSSQVADDSSYESGRIFGGCVALIQTKELLTILLAFIPLTIPIPQIQDLSMSDIRTGGV